MPSNGSGFIPSTVRVEKTRDGRSYAQAVRGDAEVRNLHSKTINLHRNLRLESWLDCSALVGEVISKEHLKNLSSILEAEGITGCKVHLHGGLGVILKFDSSDGAKCFLDSKHLWEARFKWLSAGSVDGLRFERLIWVRLFGIPVHLRDSTNISLIANDFGRGVNDEIIGFAGGKGYKIGVVEFDDDADKFFCKAEGFIDDNIQDSDEDVDEDRGSGFMPVDTSGLEEGEIPVNQCDGERNSPTPATASECGDAIISGRVASVLGEQGCVGSVQRGNVNEAQTSVLGNGLSHQLDHCFNGPVSLPEPAHGSFLGSNLNGSSQGHFMSSAPPIFTGVFTGAPDRYVSKKRRRFSPHKGPFRASSPAFSSSIDLNRGPIPTSSLAATPSC
ncbi:hypothetical protein OROGR_017907 [Orobanche gracilis]